MKNVILCYVLFMSSFMAVAQNRPEDEKQINDQIDALITSWNTHNFDDFSNYTTQDLDWVNIVGHWYKGQKQNKTHLEELHKTIFKDVKYTKSQTQIRFITENVAVVHVFWSLGAFYPPDGVNRGNNKMGDDKELGTLVMVKQNGKWLITAAHNIVINPLAAQSDPMNRNPKD
ncbi:SgcJ/EcaC family oxidoreductase [Flavobacterium azooxidireducens]|uniref:SgcJ/EcaC family oxidoreductase n=1 Tax=Flavobacterium azooxidireducens TaxID=1871076 RepID=A0ABY4KAF7_9FLAO|nr:SgcJ/EcaC family oxidoreductase [Flavobacterium azooxidireducens]UPQ77719.1 SgcJ/EcaC family oxidoreductase [Flavobacterium azooxidireducens]